MFDFIYLEAKMIMSDNNFGRTQMLERSRNIAIILEFGYLKATEEEPWILTLFIN